MSFSFKNKLNSALFKQTAILSVGTLISQIIALSITLILQRYFYSPSQFGEYSLFINITAVFASIATLKYEYALMIANDEYKARHLFITAIVASLIMSILAVIVIGMLQFFNVYRLGSAFIFLLAFCLVFFSGINDVLNYWFNRSKRYINMAMARILQSVVGEGAKIGLYFTPFSSIAMQMGRVIGFAFSASLLFVFKSKEFKEIAVNTSKSDIKKYALEEKKYPLITTPNVLINSLNAAVFSYCIFEFYGAANLGFVSVAMQYVAVPLGIISSSFGQIYFQSISKIYDMEELRSNYLTNLKILAVVAFIALIIILAVPEGVYTYILGSKWNGIAVYFRICILYMSFSFISSSLSFIYLKLDKHKILLYFSISQLILTFLSLFLPHMLGYGLTVAFLCFAVFQAIYYAFCIGLGWYILKVKNK